MANLEVQEVMTFMTSARMSLIPAKRNAIPCRVRLAPVG